MCYVVKRKLLIGFQVAVFILCLGYYYHDFLLEKSTSTEKILYARLGADCRFHLLFNPNDANLHKRLAHNLEMEAYYSFTDAEREKREALLREAAGEYKKTITLNPKDSETRFVVAQLYSED